MNAVVRDRVQVPSRATDTLSSQLPVYLREARADLLRLRRTPGALVPMLLLPWGFYALFAVALAPHGAAQATYELATYGVFAAMAPCLFGFGAAVATERENGVLGLKQVSPLPIGAFLLARLATAMTFTLVVLAGLYALAVFGAGVRLSGAAWGELLAVHLAGVAPLCLIGLCVGLRARSSAAIAISNLLFYGLAVLSGLWIPIFEFPRLMQTLAEGLPTAHLAALALGVVGQRTSGVPAVHISVVAAFTVLLAMVAQRSWVRGMR
jgi:ABC-2 type transport system permease protein